ncbi:MAG TPA: hypothetical protein VHC20_02130 [Candidatus Paceibacterota bacterium]|nr:hypothetical protein [Candidatus Paceibacterota bacterium]
MIWHYLIAAVLIISLIAVTNPWMIFMPTVMEMVALVVIAVLVAGYAGLILAEQPNDEREDAHRAFAARAGFITGIALLTAALLWQGFHHAIDAWVPSALGAMILAKVAARAWANHYR